MIGSKIKAIGFVCLLMGVVAFTFAERVSAKCCVDNCPAPDNNVCCVFDACPNPIGGGGGGGCSWSQVNCPPGGTRTGQAVSTSCGSTHCPAPGTAQAVTGCCGEGKYDEGGWYCGNLQVTTYSCCPPNTIPKSTLVNGSTYTRENSCYSSTTCNDGDDVYIRSWANTSSVCYRDCAYPDPERGCRGQEKTTVYNSITLCQEKHLQYSCAPSCDPDSWGAWSACSGTENTQTRTNACGTVETKNCPRIAGTVYYDADNNCGGSGWSSGGVAISLDGGAGSAIGRSGIGRIKSIV